MRYKLTDSIGALVDVYGFCMASDVHVSVWKIFSPPRFYENDLCRIYCMICWTTFDAIMFF